MRLPFAGCLAALLSAACSSSQSSSPSAVEVYSAGVSREAAAVSVERTSATVLAMDAASRHLTIRCEDGHIETIDVRSEVMRLGDVAVGDLIRVELQEGILIECHSLGSTITPHGSVVAAGRAGPGEPAPSSERAQQSAVTITAIDAPNRTVEFQDLDGFSHHLKAGPAVAIEKLKIGDRLLATYVATAALSVDKKN